MFFTIPNHIYRTLKIITAAFILTLLSCNNQKEAKTSVDEYPEGFPYGNVPREKPNTPMSAAFNRIYDGNYMGLDNHSNELFSRFKYTPLKGFDYGKKDGRVSRRDASKVIKTNGKYYVWYTHRDTPTPPNAAAENETIPSRDCDLAEIWYATSNDGFTWEEQGVAIPRLEKPYPGWRSVSTADILVYKGKYYLYYQAYVQMPGSKGTGEQ